MYVLVMGRLMELKETIELRIQKVSKYLERMTKEDSVYRSGHPTRLIHDDRREALSVLIKGGNPICVFGTKEDTVYRSGHPTRLIHDDASSPLPQSTLDNVLFVQFSPANINFTVFKRGHSHLCIWNKGRCNLS